MADIQDKDKELSVEESFTALDEMVKRLENDDVSLEESFKIYQEGLELLKKVGAKIDGIETRMKQLSANGELEEFD